MQNQVNTNNTKTTTLANKQITNKETKRANKQAINQSINQSKNRINK